MGKIAILGSGNGGCTYAAYLGKRGHEVRLWDVEAFGAGLVPIAEKGGIDLVVPERMPEKKHEEGFGPVAMATTDAEAVLDGVEVVMVVVPGYAIASIAKAVAPYLKSGQIVMLNPGQVFGALEFLNTLRACGNNEDITMCEAASNLFACRRTGPTTCRMKALKKVMEIATIPADRAEYCRDKLNEFFPDQFIAYPTTIYTSLTYTNLVLHPCPSILNMGRIEWEKGQFDFYWEAMTPSVCRNMEEIDKEHMDLGAALGVKMDPCVFTHQRYYGHPERTNIYDFFSKSEVHGGHGPSAPPDMHYRYVTEDIPYAFVPMEGLGKALGVPTPVISALITLASVANEEDYRKTGRTMEYLKLSGLTRDQIVARFNTGK